MYLVVTEWNVIKTESHLDTVSYNIRIGSGLLQSSQHTLYMRWSHLRLHSILNVRNPRYSAKPMHSHPRRDYLYLR